MNNQFLMRVLAFAQEGGMTQVNKNENIYRIKTVDQFRTDRIILYK